MKLRTLTIYSCYDERVKKYKQNNTLRDMLLLELNQLCTARWSVSFLPYCSVCARETAQDKSPVYTTL